MNLNISEKILRKVEWGAAILMTALCVGLHVIFLCHAGGLWRDEAGGVNLAEMSSLADVWHHVHFDSFPIFWLLVARFWWWIGLGSDFGFRVLGFLTGLLVVASIWFAARCFKLRFPLFALVLLGLSPLVIVYGDSMRAWGWGLFWIGLEFGFIWLVIERPTLWRVGMGFAAGIAAVQSTYFNSALLVAICCAGVIVALRRKLWHRGALVAGIVFVAGLTILPYLQIFRIGQEYYNVLRRPYEVGDFINKLSDAFSGAELFSSQFLNAGIWWVLLIAAVLLSLACLVVQQRFDFPTGQTDLMLYGLATILFSVPTYFCFLHKLGFVTSAWYYMPLIFIQALAFESIFSVLENWKTGRLIRLVALLLVSALLVPIVPKMVKMRMTNMDLIATRLNGSAAENDLIIVHPFYSAISFAREYSGAAKFVSLPEMDSKIHRYDVLKQLAMQPGRKKAIQNILDDSQRCLKSGGNVWFVSTIDFPIGTVDSEPVSPQLSHHPTLTLHQTLRVLEYWSKETAYVLQQHSTNYVSVRIPSEVPVNINENATLIKVSGWRE